MGHLDSMSFSKYEWRPARTCQARAVWGYHVAHIHDIVRFSSSLEMFVLRKQSRLLMFASGIPTAEKPQAKRYFLLSNGMNARDEHKTAWLRYQEYLRSTSILIPIPPALYRPLPKLLKTVLLDFPMYNFDAESDGKKALEEERQRASDSA